MMTQKTKKRIWSFWKGNLDKQEAQELLDSLESEHALEQEILRRQFEQDQQQQHELSPERSKSILQAIYVKAGIDTTPVKKMNPYIWRVAAAVLVFCGIVGLLYRAQYAPSYHPLANSNIPTSFANNLLSSDATTKRYQLSDGSTIVLSPYSSVSYNQQYGISNRKISLTGEGRFSVKRDSLLPFEVTANGYITRALGTEFIVNGRTGYMTKVELLHGKIVVRSSARSPMQITETFLEVGDKLSINSQTKAVVLLQAQQANLPTKSAPLTSSPKVSKQVSSSLNFQKTALSEVFKTIAVKFDIHIDSDAQDMNHMSFTGTFTEEDPLETVIAIICRINNLVYERTSEKSYVIRSVDRTAPQTHIILDTIKN